MSKISNLNIKVASIVIFVGLIIATNNLIIPKNILFLFLKLLFLIPSVALIVNLVNIIPKNILYLSSKIIGVAGLVLLIVVSYLSSKRKPDNVNELYNDFSWLINWPKWLDTPFMHWINSGWRGFIADYGVIFDAIGYGLLRGYTELKNVIVQAPWPVVIIGVIAITYFTSGRKVGTTAFCIHEPKAISKKGKCRYQECIPNLFRVNKFCSIGVGKLALEVNQVLSYCTHHRTCSKVCGQQVWPGYVHH